jgi:DNA-binding transcriptional MocR family regulator
MEVLPLDVEDDGMDVEALAAACAQGRVPRLLYTIPNFQNPSGATLSEPKRRRLIEIAERYDILILEDDPYGKLRFEGEALPGLFELAPAGRVIFTSSFSKTVAPGLRVGYLVSPADVAARLAGAASQTYISPALLSEAAIHQLIVNGHLPGNIARVTDLMRERRDAMMEGMRHFPEGSRCVPPQGGFFCWVTLPEGLSADELFAEAAAAGIAYVKGSDCVLEGGERTLRLAYSGVSPAEIAEGMERLGSVFRGAAAPA